MGNLLLASSELEMQVFEVERTTTVRYTARHAPIKPSFEMVRAGMLAEPDMSAFEVFKAYQRAVAAGAIDPAEIAQ